MRVSGGYVLIARRIAERFFDRPSWHLKVWMFLLTKAWHKPTQMGDIVVDRGQCLVSLTLISVRCGHKVGRRPVRPSLSQVSRLLKDFKKSEMIATKNTNSGILVTICNYETYQNPSNYQRNYDGKPTTAKDILIAAEDKKRHRQRREELLVEYIDRYWAALSIGDGEQCERVRATIKDMVRRKDLPRDSLTTLTEIVSYRKASDD